MKAKVWIMIGVLIIAFAAMVTPVMAGTSGQVGAQGDQGQHYDITIDNASLLFGTFAIGSNVISPTHPDTHTPGQWAVIKQFYTNEDTWYLKVAGDNAKMTKGSHTLNAVMTIKNATDQTGSGITGWGSAQPLTTIATRLVNGAGPFSATDIPLYIEQTVAGTDPADTNYAMTITVSYSTGA
jgi:hypothetical protein